MTQHEDMATRAAQGAAVADPAAPGPVVPVVTPPAEPAPARRRPAIFRPRRRVVAIPWRWRLARALAWSVVWFGVFAGALALASTVLAGRPVALPVWALAEAETRLNRLLEGRATVSVGSARLVLEAGQAPELRIIDMRLADGAGTQLAQVSEARTRFAGTALLRGQLEPTSVRLSGGQIALRRLADGSFDLRLGETEAVAPASLGALLAQVDEVFALPALSALERVEVEAVTITLDDLRAGRIWTVGDGRVALLQRDEDMVLDLGFGLVAGGAAPATAQMTFVVAHGAQGGRVSARIQQMAAADLAAQNPALAWLSVLDAPLSGELRAEFDAEGTARTIEGALSLENGAVRPLPEIAPVEIASGRIGFDFDAAQGRIRISELALQGPRVRLAASGHVDPVATAEGALPEQFTGQFRFDDLQLDPDGMFTEPVRFDFGAVDLRLGLNPFRVDLGQLALSDESGSLLASGQATATPEGWTLALDAALDRITHDRLLALWPLALVPRTRDWLQENLQRGVLRDVKAAVRLTPGQEPVLSLGYDFAESRLRFMPTLPPVDAARGYATIDNYTYTTVVESGHVTAPDGGRMSVARTVFQVPDFRIKPAPAEVHIRAEGPIPAALSLLDQPPFEILSKGGFGPDLAEGMATVDATLRLLLVEKIEVRDVDFDVRAELRNVRSDRLVPGRLLQAERLTLLADPERVQIAGPGRLGQAGFDATWSMPTGEGGPHPSRVEGQVTLDEAFAAEFLAALPPGTVSGRGAGRIEVDIPPRGGVPRFTLQSDLQGVVLRIADIGWTKAAAARGALEVAGTLGTPPDITRLSLEAPGLAAEGRLTLAPTGQLERLALSRLRLGGWLDAVAEISGRNNATRIVSGTADLRRLLDGDLLQPGGTRGGASAPVAVALDRVQVSETIHLTAAQGQLQRSAQGLTGQFTARLGGEVPVRVDIVPGARGAAIRLRAEDGGAALAAARLFGKARGGAMDLTLVPAGRPGHYDGTMTMGSFRVRDLPALAELLNAVSIVGLIDQLGGPGLAFAEARAAFRLTPEGVELREGAAVGASFGVSLEGAYMFDGDRLNLRGVMSPFYLVNSIGSVLTRPGEGLLGFAFRVRGTGAAPSVSVNPLSVLAPGFFRDMFRSPAARLDTTGDDEDASATPAPDPFPIHPTR